MQVRKILNNEIFECISRKSDISSVRFEEFDPNVIFIYNLITILLLKNSMIYKLRN